METENLEMLNLGTGNRPIEGAINHDLYKHRPEIDFVWDLNILPWPWKDNSFNKIYAIAVLEHLEINFLKSMNECWRILKPNGILKVKLPHWQHENCWADPTHTRGFCLKVFDFFDTKKQYGIEYGFYTDKKWKILEKGWATKINSSIYGILQVIKDGPTNISNKK